MAITVSPSVEASNWPPRVRLDVAASAGETSTTVTRTDPDGTIVPVRTGDGNPLALASSAGTLYDYEAPFGAAVTYSSQETPANVSSPVTVPASRVWLIHPGVPTLSQPVRLAPGTFTKRTRDVSQGVFWPQGRSTPIIVSDGARKTAQSTLAVLTISPDEAAGIDAVMSDAGVLLLNIPATLGYNFGTCYIAPGKIEAGPVIDKVFEQWLTFSWPFYVVARPAGGSQAQRTLADLLSYATLADLKRTYATLGDLLAGP